MGVRTIFNSKRILVMAWGIHKSLIVKKSVEGDVTSLVPVSYLQKHKNTTLVLDNESASELIKFKTPWLVDTFDRLVAQGHDVHVAYQTSGNIAVTDHDALKFLEVSKDVTEIDKNNDVKNLIKELKNKKTDQIDSKQVRKLKGFIRKSEAIAATRYIGIPDKNTHFMNLPFYETGKIQKNTPTTKDIEKTVSLIKKIKPHQIYAAGDLEDPHGTHKVCLYIIFDL